MMQADQQLNLIERHFDGSATEAEELVFQEKISADPAFREEAELHRALLASLRQAGRNDLKQLLRQADESQEEPTTPLPATPARSWRLTLLLLGGLISAGLLWWIFGQKTQPAPPAAPMQELQETLPAGETAPPAPPTPPPVEKPAAPDKKPVAALDPQAFATNPALEPMTGNSLRSAGLEIAWSQPSDDAVFYLKNDRVTVRFSGKIMSAAAPEGNCTIKVFSNVAEDFYDDKPLKTLSFKASGSGGELPFSETTNWQTRPGLYYFLLTAPGETEPAHVGKFRVEPEK
jgi:hypothetical protein